MPQIGADLKCQRGDHAFEDNEAGWGFCYPGTWKYTEHAQSVASPAELDIVLDITDVPCVFPSAAPGGPSPNPVCSEGAGLFGLMIIYTFERGDAATLADWIQANMRPPSSSRSTPEPLGDPITWGNAREALHLTDGRRIALTQSHVVILELRSGSGNLDLEAAMAPRLDTWKFMV